MTPSFIRRSEDVGALSASHPGARQLYFEDEPGQRAATGLMTRDEGSHLQCICKVGHSP